MRGCGAITRYEENNTGGRVGTGKDVGKDVLGEVLEECGDIKPTLSGGLNVLGVVVIRHLLALSKGNFAALG